MSKIYLFSAEWCSACKSLKMELDRIKGGMEYKEVDTDTKKGAVLVKEYGIRTLPTLLKVDDAGDTREALMGYRYSREVFEKFLEVPK